MRPLPICLLFTLMLCPSARAQEPKVEVNFAGIELFENDRGWKVEETRDSVLTSSPLERGDIILKVGGQGVAPLGPLSIPPLLEYALIKDVSVVVERAGQEKELSFHPPSASGSEGSRETSAMGATFRSVEDTQRIIITDISAGSPAERAGLKSEDELLAVGGKGVGEMTLTQLADLFSKPRDSGERIRVRRGSHEVDTTLKPVYSEQSLQSPGAEKMPFPLHARGEQAPAFSLPDLRGRSVALNNFRGKPVLLTFWASWCRLCVAESDLFERLNREMGTRLVVLGLDVDDDPEELQHFLKIRPLSYPILIAGDFPSPIPITYDLVGTLPVTIVIDPDGYIIYLQTGFSPVAPLESRVRSLVAQTNGN
ncbi:MAG: redoxin domain-containing protein [Terriglobia bacterium]|jgi:cytochrome c biogenesis protein CcmG, thiol:disulfide interchange protein DsbE